jgi:hypothetical protein
MRGKTDVTIRQKTRGFRKAFIFKNGVQTPGLEAWRGISHETVIFGQLNGHLLFRRYRRFAAIGKSRIFRLSLCSGESWDIA